MVGFGGVMAACSYKLGFADLVVAMTLGTMLIGLAHGLLVQLKMHGF
jgi:hypothetical protein